MTEIGADRYVYDLLSRVREASVEVPHTSCGEVTVVKGTTDTTAKSFQSCGTVQAGPSYTVGSTGNVTLTAGHEVVLANGFSVASGGRLAAGVDPALDPAGQPTAAGQSYTFDRFGNLTQVTTSKEGQADVTTTIGTFSSTNRLSAGGYDASGNLTSFPGVSWSYDPFNMLTQEASTAGSHFYFVYGPGDERIWTIDWSAGADPSFWRETWTLRDLDGSPLRQYLSIGGNDAQAHWTAAAPDFPRDYAWRGGSLLASVSRAGLLRHYHLDHLGSPRLITDAAGKTLALHLYFPFGEEATPSNQDTLSLKFTGHERDDLDPGGTTYDLDYLHARYYLPTVGRFLSFDPLGGNPSWPGSWNRYAYALGSPLKYLDPYGLEARCATSGSAEETIACKEQIEVVAKDPGPKFDPQTGVAGLQSLIIGRFLSGGADHLDLKRNQTTTIGPAPPEKPNAPARPDYVTLTFSAAVPNPYTATLFGVKGTVTLDKYGNLYGGLGPNAGKSFFFLSGTLRAGGISGSSSMGPAQIRSTLSGFTNNFTVGDVFGLGFTRSGLSGPGSAEFGLMTPTVGVSSTYSWYFLTLPIKW